MERKIAETIVISNLGKRLVGISCIEKKNSYHVEKSKQKLNHPD